MVRLLYFSLLLPIQLFCKNVPDSLQTIDLQHKNLTGLPDNFPYANIKSLLLGYNPIKVLPAELTSAKSLKSLSLNYNAQFDFEASINTLKQLKLESLSINNSNLMYLPLEIGEMKYLRKLSLTNNYIKEIPEYIFLHANLSSLNLSGNMIKALPKEIRSQENLSTLDLSKNPCLNVSETYQALFYLRSLMELQVKEANTLPSSLWNLKMLQRLNISDGTFSETALPKDANKHSLLQLTAENCDNLDFATLMPLLSCPSLKDIALGGGKFNGFETTDISVNVTHMSLTGTQLNHFSFASPLINLEDLNLNFGSITCYTELGNTLKKLTGLKNLDLSNCNITILPAQISSLKSLETLNLSGNKLSSISELSALKQLTTLNVSLCDLSKEDIEALKKELPTTTIICTQEHDKLPLTNAIVPTEHFSIDPANPKVITTQNGTTISIPKNSLVYENGKPVKEPVTINYTAYYSLADISVAGINMNYKTSETEAPFSSAGMFNLNANANGKNVELKKGSDITVAFKSTDAEQSYNYYLYDTLKRTWTQTGKDTITTLKIARQENDSVQNSASNAAKTGDIKMPQPPMFYRNHSINIEWDLKNRKKFTGEFYIQTYFPRQKVALDTSINENFFNELRPLASVKWKMDAEKASPLIKQFIKDNRLANTTPEKRRYNLKPRYYSTATRTDKEIEFDLIPDKENDNFIFKLNDGIDTVSFSAYPMIQNKNTERAQKTIKKMYFKYKELADQRKKVTKYKRDKFLAAYKGFKINMSNMRGVITEKNKQDIANLLNAKVNTDSYGITRVLALQGFGVYNCDRPIILENPIVISPVFYNEKGEKLSDVNYQVIDPKENIVVSYYGKRSIKISKNSVITFINNSYNNSKTTVSIGKLNTFELNSRNGKMDIQLTAVPPDLTIAQLSALINSTP